MLSVITFLTVAFLALMGREKGSVKIAVDQSTARLAADAAFERAKTELITSILTSNNLANFDLLVSTNFINWGGFDPAAVNQLTNVNYDYRDDGNPLTLAQLRQNLTNLFYSPRPPVFITNRLAANSQEFRSYVDLNRNGRLDQTGLWPVTNDLNQVIFQPGTNLFLSNYVVGDPQWIGGLDRPDKPHGPENKFINRYAYIVVPAGKTMDVNYIHNQALAGANMDPNGADFFRNQGIGGWEINLAAFLYDLNTNSTYGWGLGNAGYYYNPILGGPTVGNAFADAAGIYRYRLNGNPTAPGYSLQWASALYAVNPFLNDFIDGHTDGQLLTAPFTGLAVDNDTDNRPWVGADNPYHFFTTQDLLDPKKTATSGYGFANRLQIASTNVSTYDQYTYYRLLSQLGTGSAPEDPDKLNLNYVNVGGWTATNFIAWTDPSVPGNFGGVSNSVLFFTNAVDRLLKAYTAEWLAADSAVYTNLFKTTNTFGVANIPVFVSNQFIYPPSVHRVLQMAANIWDAKTNRTDAFGTFPTVFQPLFTNINNDVYISGFREVSTLADLQLVPRPPLDLTASTNLPSIALDELIYGVPLVIGAKKGLPNFNEFSMESNFLLTRKLELRKSSPGGADRIYQTNQFFTMSLTMPSAAEFWNSYAANYNRKVFIYITNRTTMTMTNDSPVPVSFNNTFVTGGFVSDPKAGATYWPSYKANDPKNESFVVAMRTNVPFLPLIGYLPNAAGNAGFVSATNASLFDNSQALLSPKWGMTITNRVQAMILDQTTGRIIDYVLLGNLTSYRDLTAEFSHAPTFGPGEDVFDLLWATNTLASGRVSGRLGVLQQINISRGANAGVDLSSDRWKKFGIFTPSSVDSAVAKFNQFFQSNNTNLQATVPFSPSIQFAVPMIWQANDPLVHYLAGELFHIAESGPDKVKKIDPPSFTITTNTLVNIGKLNTRYKPWPKTTQDPTDVEGMDSINPSMKDPLVRSSDDWSFPTNVLPSVGWLGRIHRGTPWQTVYLKSSDVATTNLTFTLANWIANVNDQSPAVRWAKWTGNKTLEEGFYSRPVTDRLLFDIFTTALNDNATRGRLPINQTGLAAWSALFSGMVALTNSTVNSLLANLNFVPQIIEPAGIYDSFDPTTWPALVRMVQGINRTRTNINYFRTGTFEHLGDILSVPELTDASPFLNITPNTHPLVRGMNDAAYEWLPQQMMSLLQLGEPRFVVYSYGQSLQPAPESIVTSGGNYFGLCTNYAITAEVATRAVVRIEGSPDPRNASHPNPKKRYPPRVVVESFNFLPPE